MCTAVRLVVVTDLGGEPKQLNEPGVLKVCAASGSEQHANNAVVLVAVHTQSCNCQCILSRLTLRVWRVGWVLGVLVASKSVTRRG